MCAAGISISVIVPVYNSERYLRVCLDSLLDQGLGVDEYEVILVNDGSSDRSPEICSSYKERHPNLRLLTQENRGVSAARNLGLGAARGEWVMFADSDDFVCRGSLRYLLENYCSDGYDGIRFWTRIRGVGTADVDMDCAGEVLFRGSGYGFVERYGLETFCYTTLYRRSFLEAKGLRFSPYRIGEDFLFASQFLLADPRICSTSSIVYQYLIHPGSASTSRDRSHARRCAHDHLEVNRLLAGQLRHGDVRTAAPGAYGKGMETIRGKMPLVFSRMLSSDMTAAEFRQAVREQKAVGALPMRRTTGGGMKAFLSRLAVNGLSAFPAAFPLARALYAGLFVPYVLPLLDRDR